MVQSLSFFIIIVLKSNIRNILNCLSLSTNQFSSYFGLKGAIPHLFERLFVISWENNRDCHISMPLSLKTVEVQIEGAYEIGGLERCRSSEKKNHYSCPVQLTWGNILLHKDRNTKNTSPTVCGVTYLSNEIRSPRTSSTKCSLLSGKQSESVSRSCATFRDILWRESVLSGSQLLLNTHHLKLPLARQAFSIREPAHGSYNLEKVLKLSSRLEKSLNSVTL